MTALLEGRLPAGHPITVTAEAVGRVVGPTWLECPCGIARAYGSVYDASRAGLRHLHDVTGGCTCPEALVSDPVHPSPPRGAPRP